MNYYNWTFILLSVFVISTQKSQAQFHCPPCNLPCDTLHFAKAGNCPVCQMVLVPNADTLKNSESSGEVLKALQKVAGQGGSIDTTLRFLSDVYGPRLLGTENYYQSLLWSREKLHSWGVDSVSFHNFDQNHRGWEVKSHSVEMIAPSYSRFIAHPAAYSESTPGIVEGEVMYLNRLDSIEAYQGQLKGKILLIGEDYRPQGSRYVPIARRFTHEILETAQENPDPNHRVLGYLGRRSITQAIMFSYRRRMAQEYFFAFARKEGVLAVLEASDYPYGILHTDASAHLPGSMHQDKPLLLPSFVLANEHFGRLKRLLEWGYRPKLRLELQAEVIRNTDYNQNLIAYIPGQDPQKREESVLLGAHLDSWHAGTGAVDNASGVTVMMEALRLLKAAHLPLKRSVELVLWGGHEQVFAGSRQYTAEFLGDMESGEVFPKAEKITAYFNVDNGSGLIRGIYTMGNEHIIPIFEKMLAPFPQQNTLTMQYTDQTDHELFDRLNIPGFQFIQDPLDYIEVPHHTNMDLYEYANREDMLQNAIFMAYLVYQVANADDMLPRKPFNSPKASREGSTLFKLTGYPNAQQVQLIGTFNNWNLFGTPMYRTPHGWECKLDLPPGEYLYKFYIDGNFTADPQTPPEDLVGDGKGHGGLSILKVR